MRFCFLFFFIYLLPISIFSVDRSLNEEILNWTGVDIKNHIEKKIDDIEIVTAPFPYAVIENIFPKDFYEEILRRIPDRKLFVSQGPRSVICVGYGAIEKINLSKRDLRFWEVFSEVIVNRFLKPKITPAFIPFLSHKFPKLTIKELEALNKDIEFWNHRQEFLICDSHQCSIIPHIDQSDIFVQLFIYLPNDNYHEHLGTTLYQGSSILPGQEIYEHNSDLTKVFTLPFKPNTLVAFMQTPCAWHGFEKSQGFEEGYLRFLFGSPIRFSPEAYGKLYSKPQQEIADLYFYDFRFLDPKNWEDFRGNED